MRSTAPQPAVDAHKTTEGLNRLRPIPSRRFARPDPPTFPSHPPRLRPRNRPAFRRKKRVKISIYTYGNPTGKADLCGVEFSQKRNELPFRKMKNLLAQLKTEDWVIVLAGVAILALALLFPAGMPAMPKTLAGGDAWLEAGCMFAFLFVLTCLCMAVLGRPVKGIFGSLLAIFAVRAGGAGRGIRPAVQGFGTGIGLLLGDFRPGGQQLFPGSGMAETGDPKRILYQNRHRLPRCDDPLRRILHSGVYALAQAFIVVFLVWYFAFWVSRRMKVDDEMATMLSSSVSICGVSAAIATCGVIKGTTRNSPTSSRWCSYAPFR